MFFDGGIDIKIYRPNWKEQKSIYFGFRILTEGVLLSQINRRVAIYFLRFENYLIYIVASLVGCVFVLPHWLKTIDT